MPSVRSPSRDRRAACYGPSALIAVKVCASCAATVALNCLSRSSGLELFSQSAFKA